MSMAIRQAKYAVRGGYAGDPGLGSFIKKLGGGIVKGIGGLFTAGPIGAVAGLASGFVGGGKPQALPGGAPVLPPQQGFQASQFGSGWGISGGTGGGITIQSPYGGVNIGGGVSAFGPGGGLTPPPQAAPGRGMRLNKSGYWLKGGQYIPPGTRWVKVRRRNPLNPRALSRSMSRLTSFKRAADAAKRITVRSTCGCK